MRSVELEWQEEPRAVKYIVELRYNQGKLLKTFTSRKPLFRFRAPVGPYEIRARIEVADGDLGPWSDWNALEVPPEAPVAEASKPPEPKVVTILELPPIQMNSSGNAAQGEFSWEPATEVIYKSALAYKAFLAENWVANASPQILEEVGQWRPAESLPPGQYRWTLSAEREGWTACPPIVREFVVKPVEPQLTNLDKEMDALLK